MRLKTLTLLLAGIFLLAGCADLSVENENAPDAERAIANASDLKAVLGGAYTSFWSGTYQNDTPFAFSAPHLDGWGDSQTTTNAFAGFWATTDEPRRQFENTLSFADLAIVEVPWQDLNAAISASNDVIGQIRNENFVVEVSGSDQTQMVLASALLVRGMSYGYLANLFNQAYIFDENFDPEQDLEGLEFSPYPDVLAQARADLQAARQIAESNTFTMDDFLPFTNPVDNERLARIANTMEARFIISNPRTAQEANSINWGEIGTLTANGIEEDLVMALDGNVWFNSYQYVSGLFWYWRVDNRIINKMDPNYPIKYPADQAGSGIDPAQTDDERLCGPDVVADPTALNEEEGIETSTSVGCYFVYDTDQSFFREARGPELQSNYFYARDFVAEQWFRTPFAGGPGPILLAEENRLMRAEAALEAGNNAQAAGLINGGSRVEKGGLSPLQGNASAAEIREAIYYERDIELYRTGLGLAFFDLRRQDALQIGTPLHLPVPATELQTVGASLYTFGGPANASQDGTADGSNAWCSPNCDGPFSASSTATEKSTDATRSFVPPTDGRTMPNN